MHDTPELVAFRDDVARLLEHPIIRAHRRGDDVRFGDGDLRGYLLDQLDVLLRENVRTAAGEI